ncbi:hypothetical protein PQU94_08035 [Asticcacaulis sp. DXS10W]|uniref:Uncharacterized protein n=1 Tax=Asticcacaulis currens TaxID=2984210 RepID=A0ABT5IE57_9CAUL|nr:hypothetical protein [Asticcacaulis currens]MDC7694228.1 hypothetical protein [Asticcacaulis currens]
MIAAKFAGAALGAMVLMTLNASAFAQSPTSAIATMNEPGPEARALAARAGEWTLTLTIHPNPTAAPIVWSDLKVSRQMVGAFLEEVISPADASQPDFKRISYFHYNRVEGRWQYVSMDTRFPAGIMPAYSVDAGSPDHLVLEFLPVAFAGWDDQVDGWMLRSSYEAFGLGSDHETAKQYWTRADGSGTRWLAVEYDYRRVVTNAGAMRR